MLVKRRLTSQILHHLTYFPIAGIIGPRQVGKTTLAALLRQHLQIPSIHLDLTPTYSFVITPSSETIITCISLKSK